MSDLRYYEDFAAAVGQSVALGSHQFTTEAIVAFATEFDPQVMHTDPDRARSSTYGGLIASGWHTASVYMRLLVDGVIGGSASVGSPGIDRLRWLKPVRPGDTLQAEFTILEARLSESRPEWGIVRSRGQMRNQQQELVLEVEAVNFFARRPPDSR